MIKGPLLSRCASVHHGAKKFADFARSRECGVSLLTGPTEGFTAPSLMVVASMMPEVMTDELF